jgi:hypothetical protein
MRADSALLRRSLGGKPGKDPGGLPEVGESSAPVGDGAGGGGGRLYEDCIHLEIGAGGPCTVSDERSARVTAELPVGVGQSLLDAAKAGFLSLEPKEPWSGDPGGLLEKTAPNL